MTNPTAHYLPEPAKPRDWDAAHAFCGSDQPVLRNAQALRTGTGIIRMPIGGLYQAEVEFFRNEYVARIRGAGIDRLMGVGPTPERSLASLCFALADVHSTYSCIDDSRLNDTQRAMAIGLRGVWS